MLETIKESNSKATVLARHLIKSFAPGEVNPIKAHKIGMELCKKILKEDYEFVLATHIDRGHIHNHIICASIRYEVNPFQQNSRKVTDIITRYRTDKDFGISYTDKNGNNKTRLLWKDSLARKGFPQCENADVIHKQKFYLKKPTLGLRLKNNKCEWCGKENNNLKVYQVKKA